MILTLQKKLNINIVSNVISCKKIQIKLNIIRSLIVFHDHLLVVVSIYQSKSKIFTAVVIRMFKKKTILKTKVKCEVKMVF